MQSVLLPDGTPDVHYRAACGGQKLRDIMLDNNIELYGPYVCGNTTSTYLISLLIMIIFIDSILRCSLDLFSTVGEVELVLHASLRSLLLHNIFLIIIIQLIFTNN